MTPFVLVDSSVWMRHFKHGDARLAPMVSKLMEQKKYKL